MTYQEFLRRLAKTRRYCGWHITGLGAIRSRHRNCPMGAVAKMPLRPYIFYFKALGLSPSTACAIERAADNSFRRSRIRRDLLKATGLAK